MIMKDLPLEERPREKMIANGPEHLSNSELLAILIRTGTKNKSALNLANEVLIIENGGLAFLARCTLEELAGQKGIGMVKACQISAAVELGKRICVRQAEPRISVNNPESIADLFMNSLRDKQKEFFRVLLLNARGEIISIDEVAVGDLVSTVVHPREVFSKAVRRSAASVVLVHNHPSGSPLPSSADIATTKQLTEAGQILGIKVVDHIIIGDGSYLSFAQKGLL